MMSRACQNRLKHRAPQDVGAEALGEHLRHHRQQPQQAGGHVQAMAADQREEGREERAARRACPLRDHARELVHLDGEKCGAEQEGHGHRAIEPGSAMRSGADAGEAAGEAREQQAGRLDRDVPQVEQLAAARSACRVADQHRVGREEGREHDDVAEQEDPEAVADDDALRTSPPAACPSVCWWYDDSRSCRGDAGHFGRGCVDGAHGAACSRASAAPRALRLARSMRATVSAGMMYSSSSRQAKTTKVA